MNDFRYVFINYVTWFKSLWSSDVIWRHRFGSTLAQVMACCLTVPGFSRTNNDILSIGTNFSEIWIKIQQDSFKKISLKISSEKWRPLCFDVISRDIAALYVLWYGPGCVTNNWWRTAVNLSNEISTKVMIYEYHTLLLTLLSYFQVWYWSCVMGR